MKNIKEELRIKTDLLSKAAYRVKARLREEIENLISQLPDPEPIPEDYIGEWGFFTDRLETECLILGKLKDVTGKVCGGYKQNITALHDTYNYFIPARDLPADKSKWPDKYLIFGPRGKPVK